MAIQAAGPYPPPQAQRQNPAWAEMMLCNIGASNSEMSAVAFYRYARWMTLCEDKELSLLFHKVSMVEMHHLDLFGELALQLGAEPRLWYCRNNRREYWSPRHIKYAHCSVADLVRNALEDERAAVRKYECQLGCIADPQLAALLERVIEDEREHIALWEEIVISPETKYT